MDDAGMAAGLHWPIKRSFIRYVARMTDGEILGGHGLHMADASTFVFPLADDPDDPPARFRGELRLQAHNGALMLRVANPRVLLGEERATLLIEHPEGAGQPMPLVTFTAQFAGASSSWAGIDVRLTADAVSLFAGYYGEGEQFDDFTVVAQTT